MSCVDLYRFQISAHVKIHLLWKSSFLSATTRNSSYYKMVTNSYLVHHNLYHLFAIMSIPNCNDKSTKKEELTWIKIACWDLIHQWYPYLWHQYYQHPKVPAKENNFFKVNLTNFFVLFIFWTITNQIWILLKEKYLFFSSNCCDFKKKKKT